MLYCIMVTCIMYILKRGDLCLNFLIKKKFGVCIVYEFVILYLCVKVMLLSVQWATSSMSTSFSGCLPYCVVLPILL